MSDPSATLHANAKLVFSTSNATLVVEQHPRGSVVPLFQEIKIYVIAVEIGPGIYSLSATPLVQGGQCASPAAPAVMFLVWKTPNTTHDESFLKITFTTERLHCSLRFRIEEEFWQLMKLLVDTKLSNVARRKEVKDLLRQSLAFIPVIEGDVKMTDL